MKGSRVSTRFACSAHHDCFSHPTSLRNKEQYSNGTFQTCKSNNEAAQGSLYDPFGYSYAERQSCLSRTASYSSCSADEESVDEDGSDDDDEKAADDEQASETSSDEPYESANALRLQEKDKELDRLTGKVALLQQRIKDLTRKNKTLVQEAALRMRAVCGTSDVTSPISRDEIFKNQVVGSINEVLKMHPRWTSKRTGPLVAHAIWNQDANLPEFLKLSRKHFRETVFTPYNVSREMDLAGGTLSYEGIDVLRRVETAGLKRFRGSMIPSKSEIKRMAGMVEWFARQKCPFVLNDTSKGESVEFDYAKSMLCITQAFHLDEIGKMRSLSVASSIDGASLTKNLSIIAEGINITDRGARCPLTKKPLLDNPTTMKAQSRNLCIPLKIMMGRETKETFAEFATLFAFLDNLSTTATLPLELAGFMPFRCMTNCDLSAQWKGLCKGGAAKVHTLPCTGCATESDALATPNATLCARWCYEHSLIDPEWMCYHKAMATPERVCTVKTEVVELLSVLRTALEEIKADSKMTCHNVEVECPLVSSTTDAASIHFLPQNAVEMRSFSLLLSNELMLRNLDIGGSMETRRETLRHSLQGEATIFRSRVSRFVADIENIVNRSILGSEDDPCQWMCPFDTKKKEIGPITMDNVRTRRVVDSLDVLVDFCVTDQARALFWTTALNNSRTAMVLLRKRDEFSNTEIAAYQSHADKFFQAWERLWQKEGITNYIHMIGSGHVADYLYKWKNLYRYSQQGWEAMNSLVKKFFFDGRIMGVESGGVVRSRD